MPVKGTFFKKGAVLEHESEELRRRCLELQKKESEFERRAEFSMIHMVSPDLIRPNPSQPRKNFDDDAILRLADSIRRYGIIQPLTVRRINPDDGILFEIIAGERRLRAAKLIGLTEVPCIIINADNRSSAELAIIENIQREDLNIFEQASAIALLIDVYSLTQEQVARQLSTSQSCVANKLRILRLTPHERELILKYGLSERHARALLRLEAPEDRIAVIEHISSRSLNVAATEDYIERLLCGSSAKDDVSADQLRRKLVLKDIRIFYNTIDRAVDTIKAAGIQVTADRKEDSDGVSFIIHIPKAYSKAA